MLRAGIETETRRGVDFTSGSLLQRREVASPFQMLDTEHIARYKGLARHSYGIVQDNRVPFEINGVPYSFTHPSKTHYKHGWRWDEGAINKGLAHLDLALARKGVRSFYKAQWPEGMVPHIAYGPDTLGYYPPPETWSIPEDKLGDLKTSGITQPPNFAIAVAEIYRNDPDPESRAAFRDEMIPLMMKEHDYLKRTHDREDSGLLTVFHPWASGRDDLFAWDESLARIISSLEPEVVADIIADVKANREDNIVVNANHRPTDEKYHAFIALAREGARHKWNYETIADEFPFAFKDTVSSALWAADNDALSFLLRETAKDETNEEKRYELEKESEKYKGYADQTREALLLRSWNSDAKQFCEIDVAKGRWEQIAIPTSGMFMPILAGAYNEEILNVLLTRLEDPTDFGPEYLIPSVSLQFEGKGFNPVDYWNGPAWPYINMCVATGLIKAALAEEEPFNKIPLSEDTKMRSLNMGINIIMTTLDMIDQCGFQEYFNPHGPKAEQGLGAGEFSWTGGSALDGLSMLIKLGLLPEDFFSSLYAPVDIISFPTQKYL